MATQVKYQHGPAPPPGSDRWICFYPTYINKERTVVEGRKIPKDKAISNPHIKEMIDVMSHSGLQIYAENKIYCSEKSKEPINRGRLKVQITKDGKIINEKFKCRNDVFLHTAKSIAQLKSRTNPGAAQQQAQGKQGKSKKKK